MYTVLYVDDEQVLLDLAKTFLERSPEFSVITQTSAQAALNSPFIAACDVIVSDYQMPEMDGIEFLKAVRERSRTLPFILFTGRGREEVVIEAINNGVDFYLQKGGDPRSQFAELAHKIRMAVERKWAVDEHLESENRLSSIFHASPIHQVITEFSTGRIVDINDRFLHDLKTSRSEVIGRTMEEIGLFIDQARYSAMMHQLEWEGVVRNAELLIRSRSGRTFTTLTSLTRLQVHGKDLIYTQSVDISEQKKAQQTINALLNAPPDVSLLLDTSGIILAANHAATVRFDLPVQDLIGMDAFTLLSPDLADLRRIKVKEAIETREPLVFLDDRTGRAYENHLYPVIGPDGEVSAVAIHSHEVTRERQAKEALKESEEKYRLVVEHSHDSIYIYRDNRFLFVNRQAEEISGYSHEELMKHDLWDFIHPDDREKLKESALKRFAGGHVSSEFQARILRKNGEVRDAEFFVDLVDYLGKPAILGIARDITEKKRAEEAIREREEQLRSLSDNLPSGIVYRAIIEPDGRRRFVYVSGGVERLHEVTVEAVLSDPMVLYNQIEDADRPALREAEDRALAMMSQLSFQARIRTPSGKKRWILLRSAPRPLPGGGTVWDGIELDITATKLAEEELKAAYEELAASQEELKGQFDALKAGQELLWESEELHRKMVATIPDIVVQVDLDGKIIFINENGVKMAGFADASGMIGTSMFSFLAPECLPIARENTRLMFERSLGPVEYPALTHDNRRIVLEVNGDVLRTQDGTPYGMVYICRDISERKKAEEALRKSEESYRRIIEDMQDVFYRIGRDGIITMISPYGARLIGFDSPADIIGKYSATDFYADPVERDEFLSFISREGVVSGYPLTLKDRHGELHYALASSRLRYDADGKVNGIEGVLHDITHLKQVENALRQANRQITLMTSITRHDIRNQLTALRGWLDLSRDSVSDPARMLELITREQGIASTIEEQINFTTFFEEMGVKEPAWLDPVSLIQKSTSALPFKNIRLDMDVSGIEIFADPLFEKVFYNLFDNALRYGGDMMTTLRVATRRDTSGLVLVVEDDGVGISETDKGHLFDRGFGKNTGLGLFLAKEILSITGMTIRETGIPGKGARFEILVPMGKFRPARTGSPGS